MARIFLLLAVVLGVLWWLRERASARQDAERARRDTATVGRIIGRLAALRAMSLAVTARLAAGDSPLVEAALVKDLGTELEQSIGALAEAALGDAPELACNADLYRTAAYVSQISPTYSLRGGTREILRGMIARGLGLR